MKIIEIRGNTFEDKADGKFSSVVAGYINKKQVAIEHDYYYNTEREAKKGMALNLKVVAEQMAKKLRK